MSKGEIRRLGEKIREKLLSKKPLSEDELCKIQNFRVSYENALKVAHQEINSVLQKIDKNAVMVYRIKRIESINSKLLRQPKMDLSRMEDIAGLRCIVKNEETVYKLKNALEDISSLKISLLHDYIKEPKENGYKSLHLKVNVDSKVLELQIRTDSQHDWATLVEITDEVFDTRLKEKNDDKGTGLYTFFQLLSKYKTLSSKEYKKLFRILKKNNYIPRLTETFEKNSNRIRKIWYHIDNTENAKFYLFTIGKDKLPTVQKFTNFDDAEAMYLRSFDFCGEKNMVMAYIPSNDIHLVCKAYSNYILLEHNFYSIIEEIVQIRIQNADQLIISYYYLRYCKYIQYHFHILELLSVLENSSEDKKSTSKWLKELNRTLEKEKKGLNKNQQKRYSKNFANFLLIELINYIFQRKTNSEFNSAFQKSKNYI